MLTPPPPPPIPPPPKKALDCQFECVQRLCSDSRRDLVYSLEDIIRVGSVKVAATAAGEPTEAAATTAASALQSLFT